MALRSGSFEIDHDANLKVDHAAPPSLDWANVIAGPSACGHLSVRRLATSATRVR